jgi:hypothetical protein
MLWERALTADGSTTAPDAMRIEPLTIRQHGKIDALFTVRHHRRTA